MGNLHNQGLIGLVLGGHDAPWFVTVRYDEDGYVKDDEEFDADELLAAMRKGVEAMNGERKQKGLLPLRLDGWEQAPHYDRSAHRLVWCLRVSDDESTSANFNTRVLGRGGHVSLNLVTSPERLHQDKPHAATLLAATKFKRSFTASSPGLTCVTSSRCCPAGPIGTSCSSLRSSGTTLDSNHRLNSGSLVRVSSVASMRFVPSNLQADRAQRTDVAHRTRTRRRSG